jgi:hypothetical protein
MIKLYGQQVERGRLLTLPVHRQICNSKAEYDLSTVYSATPKSEFLLGNSPPTVCLSASDFAGE